MPLELEIWWDGDVPGVQEHRLSLSAFGDALRNLLAAYRRIGSLMLREAEDVSLQEDTGRLANEARLLDIEIQSITTGSVGISAVLSMTSPPGATIALFPDLASRAGIELLESLDAESNGRLRNGAVRKFLGSLPRGIKGQTYVMRDAGTEVRRVELAAPRLAEDPADLPSLAEVEGEVIGVGFEPGRNEVRFRGVPALVAKDAQVELALAHRGKLMRALLVRNKNEHRLLRLDEADSAKWAVTGDRVERHIFGRWANVMQRLAN